MANPNCPKCSQVMKMKEKNRTIGITVLRNKVHVRKGRSKFWVCKPCKLSFKVGAEVVTSKN